MSQAVSGRLSVTLPSEPMQVELAVALPELPEFVESFTMGEPARLLPSSR